MSEMVMDLYDTRPWPAEVYENNAPSWPLDEELYDAQVLKRWIERQTHRLKIQGESWKAWCAENGITEWSQKKLSKSDRISYALIDIFVTPAGLMPEDLYGWERPRATS
jgi:hypothetical protein